MMTTMAVYTAQSPEHMYFICKLVEGRTVTIPRTEAQVGGLGWIDRV